MTNINTFQVPSSSSQITKFIISDDDNFEQNNLSSQSKKNSNYTETNKEGKGNTIYVHF